MARKLKGTRSIPGATGSRTITVSAQDLLSSVGSTRGDRPISNEAARLPTPTDLGDRPFESDISITSPIVQETPSAFTMPIALVASSGDAAVKSIYAQSWPEYFDKYWSADVRTLNIFGVVWLVWVAAAIWFAVQDNGAGTLNDSAGMVGYVRKVALVSALIAFAHVPLIFSRRHWSRCRRSIATVVALIGFAVCVAATVLLK